MTKSKKIALAVGVVVGLYSLYTWAISDRPAYYREQQRVRNTYDAAHGTNDDQIADETGRNVTDMKSRRRVDPSAVKSWLEPGVDRSVELSNGEKSLQHRLDGTAVVDPSYYVDVHRPWQAACIPFYEPMEVTASGYVANMYNRIGDDVTPTLHQPADDGYEQVGPNGTKEPTTIKRGYVLPLPDENRFSALIGRVVNNQTSQPLTRPFLIGSSATLNPAVIGASGCLQTAVNHNPNLAGLEGGFNVSFHPAAQPAAQHPE